MVFVSRLLEHLPERDLVAREIQHAKIAKAPGMTDRLALSVRAFRT